MVVEDVGLRRPQALVVQCGKAPTTFSLAECELAMRKR